jgi:ABC-type Zn2+ transport system substrate-binding protein/surface adhesin
MAKRTAGRRRQKLPHEYQFVLPKDVLMNKAKRAYWVMREMEWTMSKDITSVNAKDYFVAVDRYSELSEELIKKGFKATHSGKAEKRVGSKGADQNDTERGGSQGVGKDGQADMGAGVRAVNPIT